MEFPVYVALILMPLVFCSAMKTLHSGGEITVYDAPVMASTFIDRFGDSSTDTIQGSLVNQLLGNRRQLSDISGVPPYGHIIHSTYGGGRHGKTPTYAVQKTSAHQRLLQGRKGNPDHEDDQHLSSSTRAGEAYGESLQQRRALLRYKNTRRSPRGYADSLSNAITNLVHQLMSGGQQNGSGGGYQQRNQRLGGITPGAGKAPSAQAPRRLSTGAIMRNSHSGNDVTVEGQRKGQRNTPLQGHQPIYSFVININGNMDPDNSQQEHRQQKSVNRAPEQIPTHSKRKEDSSLNQHQSSSQSAPNKQVTRKESFTGDALMTPAVKTEGGVSKEVQHPTQRQANTTTGLNKELKSVNGHPIKKDLTPKNHLVTLGSQGSEPADGPDIQSSVRKQGGTKTVGSKGNTGTSPLTDRSQQNTMTQGWVDGELPSAVPDYNYWDFNLDSPFYSSHF